MKKLQWETRPAKVDDLVKLEINPRKISDSQRLKLIESLEKFNLVDIPVVDIDMQIIGGNQRIAALKAIGRGDEMIDVRFPNRKLTTKELKEYALISNTHAGEFDFELLDMHFDDIDFDDFGFEIVGLEDWEIKQERLLANQAEEDDYEIPDEIETNIKLGDLIEIGEHRLLCGNSTEMVTWDKLMNSQLADVVVTDPPYNVDYTGKTKAALKIKGDNTSSEEFFQFLIDFNTACAQYTKPGGAWYVWHSDTEGANFRKAMDQAGVKVRQCLIWVKSTFVLGRQDYQWQHEPCLYGWKEGAAHSWCSDRRQTTVLNFDRPNINGEHPTMKPILLIAYQIGNSSRAGDLVTDGFLGSGSTMVAAHQLNRKCYGIELDPKYCAVIVDRMKKFDGDLEIKINGKPWSTTKNS